MSKVMLGEVCREHKGRPDDLEGLPVVGLEHLSQSDIDLLGCSHEETTFTKGFRKGHVLFGRRRAYLKKASLAPFDGVCSGDIIVIEAIADRLCPDLLPFVIQNDYLFDFAVENSAGSLSPRVKWKDLSRFEFDLPCMEKQKELARLLWSAQEVKRVYSRLISACGEIVKSRFIEMFGSSEAGYTVELRKLGEMLDVEPQNGLYKPQSYYTDGDDGTPIVRVDAFQAGYIEDYAALKRLRCTEEEVSTYGLTENDIVINRVNGSIERVGKIAWIQGLQEETVFESNMMRFHVDERVVNLAFITAFLNSDDARHQIKACAHVANQCSINQRNVMDLKIPRPPLALQQEFADFVQRVDKSEFALKQAIEGVNATMTAILNKELGMSDVQ